MSAQTTPILTRRERVAFLISMLGVQLSSELFAQWGTYFYSPPVDTGRIVYVALGLVAFIFITGSLLDLITAPLIGLCSDRAAHAPGRWRLFPIHGRRRPFIFWGSILMTFTGIAFWFPPGDSTSTLNFIYATAIMTMHWIVYNLAYIPLLALAPELARSEKERVELGTWIAVGMILGLVVAAIVPGIIIELLDPARSAATEGEPQFSAAGYQRVAIIFALISLASFQWFVWNIRERSADAAIADATPLFNEMAGSLRLPIFRNYLLIFFCFYIGVLASQRALPYWTELGIHGDEGTVSILGVPFIITCLGAALLCAKLNRRYSVKKLMVFALATMALGLPFMYVIAVANIDDSTKLMLASIAYGVQGIGLGMMYVLITPLIGEIIDLAEAHSGKRSEAVVNSMHAVMVKAAQVLGIWIAIQTMDTFGNSPASPQGVFLVAPISAVFCMAALLLAVRYSGGKSTATEGN